LHGGRHQVGSVGVFEEKLNPVAGCPILLPRVENNCIRVPSVLTHAMGHLIIIKLSINNTL